jgi:hypothetical protein
MNRTILPLVACALLLGACGDSSDNNSGADGQNEEQALKFARCMRDNGVEMPDPVQNSDGTTEMRIQSRRASGGAGRTGPDPARVDKAMEACRKYAPNGGEPPSAAERQEMQDQALEFARCMRENGVDMPDPKVSNGGGIAIGGPGSSIRPDSPSFKKAEEACRDKMPGPRGAKGDGGPGFSTSQDGE